MYVISGEVQHQSDILTLMLLINFQTYKAYGLKSRAIKLKKSLKAIKLLSKDPSLVVTCKGMIKDIENGEYEETLKFVRDTEIKFCIVHGI